MQSIGKRCGLQMDGFSAHFDKYESILNNFVDFGYFGVVSGRLALSLEDPGPSESALKVPGPCETVLWWSDAASGRSQDLPSVSWRFRDPLRVSCPTGRNYSGQVATCRNLSQLVATCRNLSELVWSPVALRAVSWVPILEDFQASCLQAVSIRPAVCFRQAGGTEGWPSRSSTLDR